MSIISQSIGNQFLEPAAYSLVSSTGATVFVISTVSGAVSIKKTRDYIIENGGGFKITHQWSF